MGLKPSFGVSCRPILLSVNLAWKVCGRQGCLFPASSPVARESGDEGSDGDGKGRKSFPSLSARASRLLFLTAPHWALGKAVVEEAGLFHLLSLTLPSTLMVHSKRDLLYRNTGRHVKKSNKSWKRIKIQGLTFRPNSLIYKSKPVKHFQLFFGEYGKFELSTRDMKIFALTVLKRIKATELWESFW